MSYTVYYLYTYDAFEDWPVSDYIVAKTRGQAKSKFVHDIRHAGYDVEWTQPMQIRKLVSFDNEVDAVMHQDKLRLKAMRASAGAETEAT